LIEQRTFLFVQMHVGNIGASVTRTCGRQTTVTSAADIEGLALPSVLGTASCSPVPTVHRLTTRTGGGGSGSLRSRRPGSPAPGSMTSDGLMPPSGSRWRRCQDRSDQARPL
jgi:hypothetical protein